MKKTCSLYGIAVDELRLMFAGKISLVAYIFVNNNTKQIISPIPVTLNKCHCISRNHQVHNTVMIILSLSNYIYFNAFHRKAAGVWER